MTIEERLEKLEIKLVSARHTNRLLVVLGIGALLVMWFFASGTPTAQDRVQDEIRARKFILEDENGTVRARLGMFKDGPGLFLYDENGKTRSMLSVNEMGPTLILLDENGEPRAMLRVTEVGPSLSLSDEKGKTRATLGSTFMDVTLLDLNDKNGKTRVGLGVTKDGSSMALLDENGKMIWQAP